MRLFSLCRGVTIRSINSLSTLSLDDALSVGFNDGDGASWGIATRGSRGSIGSSHLHIGSIASNGSSNLHQPRSLNSCYGSTASLSNGVINFENSSSKQKYSSLTDRIGATKLKGSDEVPGIHLSEGLMQQPPPPVVSVTSSDCNGVTSRGVPPLSSPRRVPSATSLLYLHTALDSAR